MDDPSAKPIDYEALWKATVSHTSVLCSRDHIDLRLSGEYAGEDVFVEDLALASRRSWQSTHLWRYRRCRRSGTSNVLIRPKKGHRVEEVSHFREPRPARPGDCSECMSSNRASSLHLRSLAFARELYVWHRLKHPNVLSVEGFCIDEPALTKAWIATRWQANGHVREYLEHTKPDQAIRLKLASEHAPPSLPLIDISCRHWTPHRVFPICIPFRLRYATVISKR